MNLKSSSKFLVFEIWKDLILERQYNLKLLKSVKMCFKFITTHVAPAAKFSTSWCEVHKYKFHFYSQSSLEATRYYIGIN